MGLHKGWLFLSISKNTRLRKITFCSTSNRSPRHLLKGGYGFAFLNMLSENKFVPLLRGRMNYFMKNSFFKVSFTFSFTSAFLLRSNSVTFKWPRSTAQCNGVRPSLSAVNPPESNQAIITLASSLDPLKTQGWVSCTRDLSTPKARNCTLTAHSFC